MQRARPSDIKMPRKPQSRSLLYTVGCIFFACSGWAFAHSGATGIVKQRMDAMKDIAAQMKQIGTMINGSGEFDAAVAAVAAETIVEHAKTMLSLFPEGSNQHPSEALTAIWSDWQGFSDSAGDFAVRAAAFYEIAGKATSAAEMSASFMSVGMCCSTCHEAYRVAK